MVTERPTSNEKTENTSPPSRRDAHTVAAVGDVGDRNRQRERGAECDDERDGDAHDADAEVVGNGRRGDGERHAAELVDHVEAEEDEQRPNWSVAGEPFEPPDRVAETGRGPLVPGCVRRGLREHRDHAAPPPVLTGVGTSSCGTGAGSVMSGTAASTVASVATSASRLGTMIPRRRASERSPRSRSR